MRHFRRCLALTVCLIGRVASAAAEEDSPPSGSDWQLTRVRVDAGGFRSPWIEGYCSKQSVEAGETIDIMVSANPPQKFQIELFAWAATAGSVLGW